MKAMFGWKVSRFVKVWVRFSQALSGIVTIVQIKFKYRRRVFTDLGRHATAAISSPVDLKQIQESPRDKCSWAANSVDFYHLTSGLRKIWRVGSFHQRGVPMIFLLRAVFWTAVVMMFVPGAFNGTGHAAGLKTLQTFKADAIERLARVRAELNERDIRAP
jgi:hypothetical protein